jgi:hypothetical protein
MAPVGKHSAAPASPGTPERPRDASAAGARHSTAEFSRGDLDLPVDEPIELLAEPLTEPLHEPLAPTAPTGTTRSAPPATAPVDQPAGAATSTRETQQTHRATGARRATDLPESRPSNRTGRRRQVASYAAPALGTALAWAVLVYLAIRLGPDVKAGEVRAWLLMAIATVGAMACLFLPLILAGRVLEALRPRPHDTPPPPPGGRRAKR